MRFLSRFPVCLLLLAVPASAILSQPTYAQDSTAAQQLPKRIVGDYGYWTRTEDPPYSAAQIPFNMLTHINHAGVSFNADGSLSVPSGFLEPDLITKAHANGVKVLLLIGGDFPGVEANGTLLTLIEKLTAFAAKHDYDGFDIDWEYPATTQDRDFFVELMAGLRDTNSDYVLSIDAAPWGGYGYDLAQLQKSIDYFNIMMYDCAGPWTDDGQLNSPIFWDGHDPEPWECQPGGSAAGAAKIFLNVVPPLQLNMGTPFYGYFYTNINQLFGVCPNSLTDKDQECNNKYVLTENYAPFMKNRVNRDGWETFYDPIALVPYMLRTDGTDGYITYDDPVSTYLRVSYSDWILGLGGTFMWSLDADYDGHSQDLLQAMYQATINQGQ
ncbi:MAG: glycoside hydrolase family 18 protein [Candidatus Sulfotelmatobacter sp.]